MQSSPDSVASIFIELGAATVGLAILARLARAGRFSPIPLYLLAGLAFGTGGLLPLHLTEGFIEIGAEIGVLMLLFMLGLEYSGRELQDHLRTGVPAGIRDFVYNFTPGLVLGLWLGWQPMAAVLLGGVTWISSSGVIAKLLSDLGRLVNPETETVLSVLVIEDLSMAVYLPLVAVVLLGGGPERIAVSVLIALAAVSLVLLVAIRFGSKLSDWISHESDEVILLTMFGSVLLVGGVAQRLQVSPAIGAFLVGIAASGPLAEQSHRLLAPLRDLFSATFFFFFGLQINPAELPKVLPLALSLGAVTGVTKLLSGYQSARRVGIDHSGGMRAGLTLLARGEFSIVIAGLGAELEPQLGSLAAAYVLVMAIAGSVIARFAR